MRASGAKRRRGLINIVVDAFLAASSDGDFDALLAVPRSCRSGAIDPNVWSGRALQENFRRVGECVVLHQCIRPLTGASCAPGHHGISARASSLPERPQGAIWVTSVRMRREDRSSISFVILSQTSAGKAFELFALNYAA